MARHRTVQTKGALCPTTAKLMMFKRSMAEGENGLPQALD
ncbi:hypothetical protein GMJLKIPL_6123 [Methylobacterium isbiliense]|jgi:hypothetical protein|uniref:Uncharacterized protein n=1 Tax=Methylobacterium isbiliense TaxID=315478 RepID=A0ABQ4SLZ7_9HYPH|nr:hypothetical protein GMJLKIPL_6123 [Methylobacterium isbiliense]